VNETIARLEFPMGLLREPAFADLSERDQRRYLILTLLAASGGDTSDAGRTAAALSISADEWAECRRRLRTAGLLDEGGRPAHGNPAPVHAAPVEAPAGLPEARPLRTRPTLFPVEAEIVEVGPGVGKAVAIKVVGSGTVGSGVPHAAIVAAWDAIMPPGLPRPRLDDALMRLITARWKEAPERRNLPWWEGFFREAAASDFLTGRTKSDWRADLRWILKAANFAKVLEGNYRNRTGPVLTDTTARNLALLEGWKNAAS
jgi:hypothetical protein